MKKALLSLLLVIPLVACSKSGESSVSSIIDGTSNKANPPSELKAVTSGHFTEPQINYLNNEDPSNTSPYNGNMSVSKPLPISLTWESEINASYFVEIYKDEDLKEKVVTYQTSEKSFDFYNPIFNQDYYIKVCLKDTDGGSLDSEVIHVKESPTVKGPRNLYVDGVENIRDIGGWGYIKQGMLYRSGRFNEDKAEEVNVTISNAGINEINNHLKIKTEIDLRRTSNNEVGGLKDKSVLGENVNYIQLPMAYGGNNILTFTGKLSGDDYVYDNPAEIKEFFNILADEKNYPINFHCSIGKDRTGCMAYLIEGLLGFDQETMYRDYMFTNFADAGMCKLTDITDRYGETINNYESGETLQEKIYNYLNQEIGVSTDNLDNIINILKA